MRISDLHPGDDFMTQENDGEPSLRRTVAHINTCGPTTIVTTTMGERIIRSRYEIVSAPPRVDVSNNELRGVPRGYVNWSD